MTVGRYSILAWLSLAVLAAVVVSGCENRSKTATGSVPETSTGTTIDDSIITTKVKSGFLADPGMKGLDPKVETRKGTVQLSGFVANQWQMDRATEIARAVPGVKGVENRMDIGK